MVRKGSRVQVPMSAPFFILLNMYTGVGMGEIEKRLPGVPLLNQDGTGTGAAIESGYIPSDTESITVTDAARLLGGMAVPPPPETPAPEPQTAEQ